MNIIIINAILSYESCEMAGIGCKIMIFTSNVTTVSKVDVRDKPIVVTHFYILNIIRQFNKIRNTSLCKNLYSKSLTIIQSIEYKRIVRIIVFL